jgi:hypothetical protein
MHGYHNHRNNDECTDNSDSDMKSFLQGIFLKCSWWYFQWRRSKLLMSKVFLYGFRWGTWVFIKHGQFSLNMLECISLNLWVDYCIVCSECGLHHRPLIKACWMTSIDIGQLLSWVGQLLFSSLKVSLAEFWISGDPLNNAGGDNVVMSISFLQIINKIS